MGARVYDPYTGTFTQTDRIQGGGANAYGYANGDPVNELDLDGDAAKKLAKKVADTAKKVACVLACGGTLAQPFTAPPEVDTAGEARTPASASGPPRPSNPPAGAGPHPRLPLPPTTPGGGSGTNTSPGRVKWTSMCGPSGCQPDPPLISLPPVVVDLEPLVAF